MHSIEFIRNNTDEFDRIMLRRGIVDASKEILVLDARRRELVGQTQHLQQLRNQQSNQMASIKDKASAEALAIRDEVKKINNELQGLQEKEKTTDAELNDLLLNLPNLLSDDVPLGATEEDNVVTFKYGEPRKFKFTPKAHFELGEYIGQMDFVQTAKISGSRFVTLKGDLARLEKALARLMLDIHTKEFGYSEVSPPLLVLPSAMYGAGQLPKFYEDSFVTTNDLWLIPTSEVTLVNMVSDSIVSESSLPLRYTAFTPNFRSEAGSAGKDTRGMIRQHQFYKVELVVACTKAQYLTEYENLMKAAQTVLEKLELPFQKVLKCVGDTGFSAEKSYDFEVWMPAQNCYREISSCSICGQFQARRLKARYKDAAGINHLFTMNGTGVAVGRALAALLENFQEEDGSIVIPKALQSYMNGQTKIGK